MFMCLTLAVSLLYLTATQAWLYDGTTPIDCLETWSDWECGPNFKEFRRTIIHRHPSADGAPCNSTTYETRDISCVPTIDEICQAMERYFLTNNAGSNTRAGEIAKPRSPRSGLVTKRDLLIIFDMSESSSNAFDIVKNATTNLLSLLGPEGQIGSGMQTQVALLAATSSFNLHFVFNGHNSLADLQVAVQYLGYTGGANLGNEVRAMEFARTQMFRTNPGKWYGLRPDSRKELLLITDGQATGANEVESEAQQLKNMGVEVFTFGINENDDIDYDHLERVASSPGFMHDFRIADANELTEILSQMRH
ncbi:collagen alpha-1(XII) chain-like [Branchiostoma floridae x Branchiostoma belcheri]